VDESDSELCSVTGFLLYALKLRELLPEI